MKVVISQVLQHLGKVITEINGIKANMVRKEDFKALEQQVEILSIQVAKDTTKIKSFYLNNPSNDSEGDSSMVLNR